MILWLIEPNKNELLRSIIFRMIGRLFEAFAIAVESRCGKDFEEWYREEFLEWFLKLIDFSCIYDEV